MKSAVLIIDVQNSLFEPAPRPFEADEVVEQINKVISWARSNKHPIIFIQHEQNNTEIEYESTGWQLVSRLNQEASDYFVRKTTPDSFLKTNLHELLIELEVEHLIICGYATEFCVDTTTRRAAGLGYSVDLVSDAHTTHDKSHATGNKIREHHNNTLSNISSFGVKIKSLKLEELVAKG